MPENEEQPEIRLSVKCQSRQEAVKESSFPRGTPAGFGVAKSFSCLLGKHTCRVSSVFMGLSAQKGLIG
jgi:hypothetical protein